MKSPYTKSQSKKKKYDSQKKKITNYSPNIITNYTTDTIPPSIMSTSTLITVSSVDAALSRYSDRNSRTIKFEGDNALFPAVDVNHTLEGATCFACKNGFKD